MPAPKGDLRELFEESGLRVSTPEVRRRSLASFGRALLGLGATTVLLGLLGVLPPVLATAVLLPLAEPGVAVWKDIDDSLPEVAIAQRNVLYDKNGAPFAELWEEDRVELGSLSEVSEWAKQGLIDTEDKRFYEHAGFDLRGTLRSALRGSGGGSGITQQLVKNLQFYNLLGRADRDKAVEASLTRKVKELKTSLRFEEEHSKDEILLMYFNTVAFGGPSIYGIETASNYFFGKAARDLTLAEAAALVGSAQNPSLHNLSKSEDSWKPRQEAVLGRMLAEGHITRAQFQEARAEKLTMVFKSSSNGNCYASVYPLYCKYVYDELLNSPRLGSTRADREALLAKGGLQVKTYLDPTALQQAEAVLQEGFGNTNRVVAPTAVVQPGTGGVVAIAQNRAWGDGEGESTLVVPTISAGEGSVYKIFTLAAAVAGGMEEKDLTFSSLGCPLVPGGTYAAPPGGFKNSESCALQGGLLDFKQATAYSSNTWYVTLEMKITVEAVKAFSASVGLAAPEGINNSSLAYTLGTVGNSPVEVAAALATFSNRGVYCPPTPVASVTYSDGREPATPDTFDPASTACRAVMSPHAAGIVLKALRANVSGEIPNAFGAAGRVEGYDTGGKSGTNELLNSTWAQVSSQYALFTNVYDMTEAVRGIDGVVYKGWVHGWRNNTAQEAGADIMGRLLRRGPNQPMDYDNPSREVDKSSVDQSAFFAMPSVVGMEAAQAVAVLQGQGLVVHVSKTLKDPPPGFPPGVVVEQSVAPGEKLAKGTKREILLYLGRQN